MNSAANFDVGEPFWLALAEGRLTLPWCKACAQAFFYPRVFCPMCWGDGISWIDAAGEGAVFAATIVYRPFQGIEKADLPLVVALVDLVEGVRVPGVLDVSARHVEVGTHVRLSTMPHARFPLRFTVCAVSDTVAGGDL